MWRFGLVLLVVSCSAAPELPLAECSECPTNSNTSEQVIRDVMAIMAGMERARQNPALSWRQ